MDDAFDKIKNMSDEDSEELKRNWVRFLLPFVGDRVKVVDGGRHHNDAGRITLRKGGKFGVVFDWDQDAAPVFYSAIHLERVER